MRKLEREGKIDKVDCFTLASIRSLPKWGKMLFDRLPRRLRLGMTLVQMAESPYLGRRVEVYHTDVATQIRAMK